MSFLKRIFMRPFAVKVAYFYIGDMYRVLYAKPSFLFRRWRSLRWFFYQSHGSGTQCWTHSLYHVDEAERIARSLKSMRDVDAHHAPQERIAEQWYREEEEWWSRNVPYKEKAIKS